MPVTYCFNLAVYDDLDSDSVDEEEVEALLEEDFQRRKKELEEKNEEDKDSFTLHKKIIVVGRCQSYHCIGSVFN